ncbi:MAG: DUF481 domain-containing protein [Bacteroidota bacterium]
MRITRIIFIFFLLAGSQFRLHAQKIDTIFFQNGDKLTGEVKSLEHNQLRLSTNDAGTVNVEWNKIDSVKILSTMRVELEDGRIMYGVLLTAGIKGSCYIWRRAGDPYLAELIRIVYLSPIRDRFVNRLDGFISSGFSYVKASEIMQVNFNGSIKYLAEKNVIETFYDGILTRESGVSKSQRHHGGASFRRILPRNWFFMSQVSAESNTELELDLRTNVTLGGGKSLIRTNFVNLHAATGLQVNRENTSETQQYNLESVFIANYSMFVYDDPEVSFEVTASLIPSLNDPGRIRNNIRSSLKWEVFKDFFFKWSFYFSYDNRPLSETAAKFDWAVTLLGLEYKL